MYETSSIKYSKLNKWKLFVYLKPYCNKIPFSREGHVETTRLLLNKGAEINTPSGSNDDTPLTLACWKGIHVRRSLL